MNKYTERELQAAKACLALAEVHAADYAGEATGILLVALELATPGKTPEQRRDWFFRDDQNKLDKDGWKELANSIGENE